MITKINLFVIKRTSKSLSWRERGYFANIAYLSNVYCLAASKQNSAAPSVPHAMPYLALFRHPNGPYSGKQLNTNIINIFLQVSEDEYTVPKR